MKRIVSLSVSLMAALTLLVGCGSGDAGTGTSKGTPSEQSVSSSGEMEELTQDETPLDVETASTPEGVVNAFFRSFFRGDSEGAYMLLSKRARDAQSENFVAQASESIRWRVVEKSKINSEGRVFVWVEVEDYAESGKVQRDTLTFAMTRDGDDWRVAGFNVGDVAVDFEESVIVAQEAPEQPRVERTAVRLDETSVIR
ncbi:MAG: hypothetical protein ACI4NP_05765 [Thermoguttaceae bacterium]